MSEWYYKVSEDPTDLTPLVECLAYFEDQYEEAKKEVAMKGSLERDAAKMPGIVEHRFSQLQEIEAIREWMENELKRVRHAAFRKYFENYNKTLTSREANAYADADDKVLAMTELLNRIALIRNKFMGIMKGLEYKHFQISNVTKLRVAGLEDADIDY